MRAKKTAFLCVALLVVVTVAVAACGSSSSGTTAATSPAVTTGSTAGGAATTAAGGAATTAAGGTGSTAAGAADGATVFADNCTRCHGQTGQGGVGPNLTHETDQAKVENQVKNGGQRMPPFGSQLTDAQISAVVQYVLSLNGK